MDSGNNTVVKEKAVQVDLLNQSSQDVIKSFQIHSQDCGSPEVQVALLTQRLQKLSKHFTKSPKDNHSKKGMLDLISRRKRLLQYLREEDVARYRKTIAALGLRK
jgi:small subunit ribosomal protein S15